MIRVMERHGLSHAARVCELVGLDRSTLRYRCRRPDDSALRQYGLGNWPRSGGGFPGIGA